MLVGCCQLENKTEVKQGKCFNASVDIISMCNMYIQIYIIYVIIGIGV